MLGLGIQEGLIVLAILLLLFGATRLPKVSRALGQAMRELKEALPGRGAGSDG